MPDRAIIASGKRARNKHANRAAILQAARELFAEAGYGATTVRDILSTAPGLDALHRLCDRHHIVRTCGLDRRGR